MDLRGWKRGLKKARDSCKPNSYDNIKIQVYKGLQEEALVNWYVVKNHQPRSLLKIFVSNFPIFQPLKM